MGNHVSNDMVIGILAATILILIIVVFVVLLFFLYQRRKEKQAQKIAELDQKTIEMENRFKREILQTQLEIQEQTMKTISQEIHDNIGQGLTLAKLNLSTMPLLRDERMNDKVINSKSLISKAITDLRDLSHSLDTDYIQEMGLQRAIEYELERIQKTEAAHAVLEVEGNAYRLSKQKELILFRITQEAFTNSLKHGEPATVRVMMNYTAEGLSLIISDDGKGMDLLEVNAPNSGVGARNMRSRADMIGASIRFESSPGNGTAIHLFLPFENNKDA